MTGPHDVRLRRRHLLALAAAGLLPAACSRPGTRPGQAGESGEPSGPASASPASPSATVPTYPWAGQGVVPATPGKALLGAYVGLTGVSLPDALALRRSQLGRDLRIVHYFYAWADDLPAAYPGIAANAYPMVSWRGTTYVSINNGSQDRHIAANARNLAKFGRPMLLRYAWEMNGDWYGWGGPRNSNDIAGFITAWRRVYRIFREQGATNVSWVWGPNWNSRPDTPANNLSHYYPGDEYVDWVGVSAYPHNRETAETLFGSIYREYTDRKPLMMAEVAGIDHGGRTKADWVTRLDQWVDEHPAVAALVWFDTDTHPWSTENFRIDSSPEVLAAYRSLAADPRFAA